jgi:hypothetical protein
MALSNMSKESTILAKLYAEIYVIHSSSFKDFVTFKYIAVGLFTYLNAYDPCFKIGQC